jgi:DUF2075 family protein
MPAYFSSSLEEFIASSPDRVVSMLHAKYASDGFSTQYTTQTDSWIESVKLLQFDFASLLKIRREASAWKVLLEFPLYRLRRRIDLVILTPANVVVVELKVGETKFTFTDRRQVEEYALDLRDFHEPSAHANIIPVLWCTGANSSRLPSSIQFDGVCEVVDIGSTGLGRFLCDELHHGQTSKFKIDSWEAGSYKPVPSVISAATTLFSGHGVREIAQADACNLNESSKKIIEIIRSAKKSERHALVFLAGVPGSGKTLAGLQVVHEAIESGAEDRGDIVYLSGNTPLVVVLREALARDEAARRKTAGQLSQLATARDSARTRIQHIIDFLREYLTNDNGSAPHEHVIVFDEAQRAWDEDYGRKKFGRPSSEPKLLLDIMARHRNWSVIVALIGGGQEINSGENGIAEWGKALRSLDLEAMKTWDVYGPPGLEIGTEATAKLGTGDISGVARTYTDEDLELRVPLRSFRSPSVSKWVSLVLDGNSTDAKRLAEMLGNYPLVLCRSLDESRNWLKHQTRGERRFGLVASSGARRLRAEGLGVTLNATDGSSIAQWYLNEHGDVRSSFALEVTANEYTTQGLELDFVGLCWGGDLVRKNNTWLHRQFRGNCWNKVNIDNRRFITNSYRVLMTRGREGLMIWVPRGSKEDATRDPKALDETAEFLISCGAKPIGEGDT